MQYSKSKTNMPYTSGNFQVAKMFSDNPCPQLHEGIRSKAMGVECYWGLVIPLNHYPVMHDYNQTN